MRGALKVLNDSLKKTSVTLLPRAQLKQAIDIVREEWFKVKSNYYYYYYYSVIAIYFQMLNNEKYFRWQVLASAVIT